MQLLDSNLQYQIYCLFLLKALLTELQGHLTVISQNIHSRIIYAFPVKILKQKSRDSGFQYCFFIFLKTSLKYLFYKIGSWQVLLSVTFICFKASFIKKLISKKNQLAGFFQLCDGLEKKKCHNGKGLEKKRVSMKYKTE